MTDLICCLYKISKTGLERYFMLLNTDSLEFALMQMWWTWRLQLKVGVNHMPKCLCSVTLFTTKSLKIIGGDTPKSLLAKIISFVLSGLNFTFHFSAHAEILSKSLFNISAVSAGLLAPTGALIVMMC